MTCKVTTTPTNLIEPVCVLLISANFTLSCNRQRFPFIELSHVASARTTCRPNKTCHGVPRLWSARGSCILCKVDVIRHEPEFPRGVLLLLPPPLLLFGSLPTITVLFNGCYWPDGVQVHTERGHAGSQKKRHLDHLLSDFNLVQPLKDWSLRYLCSSVLLYMSGQVCELLLQFYNFMGDSTGEQGVNAVSDLCDQSERAETLTAVR